MSDVRDESGRTLGSRATSLKPVGPATFQRVFARR